MSMKPKADIGRSSFDFVLKTVALVGLIDLSMLRARKTDTAVLAGGTEELGNGKAGIDGRAGLMGRVALLGLLAALGLVTFLGVLLGIRICFPS
jgi:hypothetical protein